MSIIKNLPAYDIIMTSRRYAGNVMSTQDAVGRYWSNKNGLASLFAQ